MPKLNRRPNRIRAAIGEALQWFINGAVEAYYFDAERGLIEPRQKSIRPPREWNDQVPEHLNASANQPDRTS